MTSEKSNDNPQDRVVVCTLGKEDILALFQEEGGSNVRQVIENLTHDDLVMLAEELERKIGEGPFNDMLLDSFEANFREEIERQEV